MLEQAEPYAPCSAIAVHGGRALVQAHDLSNVTLEALVREADALADLEVLLAVDLRREYMLIVV